jgi:hypothetical protein
MMVVVRKQTFRLLATITLQWIAEQRFTMPAAGVDQCERNSYKIITQWQIFMGSYLFIIYLRLIWWLVSISDYIVLTDRMIGE